MSYQILGSGTGSSGGVWTKLYEIDFSAQSSHDFTSVSTKAIDGVTFTGVNMANADAFDITNGSGLVMNINTASSANKQWGPNQTAPYVKFTLQDAIADYALTDMIRVTMNISSENRAADFDGVHIGYYNSALTEGHETRVGYNSGDVVLEAMWDGGSRSNNSTSSANTVAGLIVLNQHAQSYRATSYEDLGGLTNIGSHAVGVTPGNADFDASTDVIVIGIMQGTSTTNFSATVDKFKIERFE